MKPPWERLGAFLAMAPTTSGTSVNLARSPKGRLGSTAAIVASLRRAACAGVAIVAGIFSTAAVAQTLPIIGLVNASVFEGNSGTIVLKIPFVLSNTPTSDITGKVKAIPQSGNGFNAATGGVACGPAGVDFESFNNVGFTIPAGTLPTSVLYIGVRICSDSTVEPNEHIGVFLTEVVGALCPVEGCFAIGTILNDDGPPRIQINDVSASEPASGSKNMTFAVTLSHPSIQPFNVNYVTRNGTALAGSDYISTSGSVSFPVSDAANPILSKPIAVPILSGTFEPFGSTENFFVDLTLPNASVATLLRSTGRGTIVEPSPNISPCPGPNCGLPGGFELSPDNAVAQVGETVVYAATWTVPDTNGSRDLVWRDLKSIDFRLGSKALWLRWEESTNLFSLCRKAGKHEKDDDEGDDEEEPADRGKGKDAECTPGGLPGSPAFLETKYMAVDLAETAVIGSGSTGRAVTLELALVPLKKANGHSYDIELGAMDDFGNEDAFAHVGKLSVEKSKKQ